MVKSNDFKLRINMSDDIEIRKIPKKTSIIIGLIIVLGIMSFFLVSAGKAAKATKILNQLGIEDISDVTVYGTQEFLEKI